MYTKDSSTLRSVDSSPQTRGAMRVRLPGWVNAMTGNKVETKAVLDQLKQHPSAKQVPYRIAAIYLALGDKARAIRLIEEDYRNHSSWLNRLRVDPVMDPLRNELRFKALSQKLNFQA
jgi:hypothetical protein